MAPPVRIGRYLVLEFLGQGSMGVVYRGRDETLERDVALKVMSLAQSADDDARARFRREAQAAARLQHPNIVTIYELGMHRDAPFIAMELLEGMDLARAIESGLRPDPRATLPIVLQILAGLGHAHDNGIVHRDIKPSNVFLPRGLPAKIMDFGVARLVGATSTGSGIVGSPSYMSPEQVQGRGVDGRSDLFSVGLILYELVTGERAFKAGSVAAVLYKIANESPDFSALPQAGEWLQLRSVLERALARRPEERYSDARSMASDLAQALVDLGGSSDWASASDRGLLVRATPRPRTMLDVRPPPQHDDEGWRGPGQPDSRSARSKWPLAIVAFSIVLLALSVGVGLLLIGVRQQSSSTPTSTLQATTTLSPLTPSPANQPSETPLRISLPPTTTPIASDLQPAETQQAETTPFSVRIDASPTPSAAASLEHAEALFHQGRFQSAMNEARTVLKRDPYNEGARALLEDAEAALVVEERLKNARAAIQRGDRDVALEEVRSGLAVAPNDARLLQLFRQLTND